MIISIKDNNDENNNNDYNIEKKTTISTNMTNAMVNSTFNYFHAMSQDFMLDIFV